MKGNCGVPISDFGLRGKGMHEAKDDLAVGRQTPTSKSPRLLTSLNYTHANPVRHKCVKDSRGWRWNCLRTYLEGVGRDTLKQ